MKTRSMRAYTMIELIAAMAVAMILVLMVFYVFTNTHSGLMKAQREIAFQSAMRAAMNSLETHLRHIIVKSGSLPQKPGDHSPPQFKALNQGLFRIRWPGEEQHLAGYTGGLYQDGRCRYLGFYTTRDGSLVDRVEIWFNPPEPATKWTNNADDDGDDNPNDAANPLHLQRDDRGRLMLRRVSDAALTLEQYGSRDNVATSTAPTYRAPRLTGDANSEYDSGEILVDGIRDVYFEFLFRKNPQETSYSLAPAWPWSDDPARSDTDSTGAQWPRSSAEGRQPRGLSFIALPEAVLVTFEVEIGAETRKYQKTIQLQQSQWHEFISRKD